MHEYVVLEPNRPHIINIALILFGVLQHWVDPAEEKSRADARFRGRIDSFRVEVFHLSPVSVLGFGYEPLLEKHLCTVVALTYRVY